MLTRPFPTVSPVSPADPDMRPQPRLISNDSLTNSPYTRSLIKYADEKASRFIIKQQTRYHISSGATHLGDCFRTPD
jgi:hypothetical protein